MPPGREEGEMARLIDIARTAGVSEATVSRVLNGRAGVNEETRRSVVDVARRMGRDVGLCDIRPPAADADGARRTDDG